MGLVMGERFVCARSELVQYWLQSDENERKKRGINLPVFSLSVADRKLVQTDCMQPLDGRAQTVLGPSEALRLWNQARSNDLQYRKPVQEDDLRHKRTHA
jgi:hypothetical protein